MTAYQMQIAKILAHNLRYKRQERQLTQREVAENAKISLRQYQKMEFANANPTLDTLCGLGRVFKTTVDQLIRVSRIRTKHSARRYCDLFRNCFHQEKYAAGIRSHQGEVIWGNSMIEQLGLPGHEKPADMLKFLEGPATELLMGQLMNERNGDTTNYTNFFTNRNTGQTTFLRFYPVIILPEKGMNAYFSALYITRHEFDSPVSYYRFCEKLLSID